MWKSVYDLVLSDCLEIARVYGTRTKEFWHVIVYGRKILQSTFQHAYIALNITKLTWVIQITKTISIKNVLNNTNVLRRESRYSFRVCYGDFGCKRLKVYFWQCD